MTTEHRKRLHLATASLMDLIARAQAIQAAVLREDDPEMIERMRAEAHDVMDAYLDHMTASARLVRQIIED